jgi:UDP-glucuronate 4-epimerase
MKIFITDAVGFIGFHLVKAMVERDDEVVGLDNLSGERTALLPTRLSETGIPGGNLQYNLMITSGKYEKYRFIRLDIKDKKALSELLIHERFDCVCHLAAKTGVRHSGECPEEYIHNNVMDFVLILEACYRFQVKRLFYASGSGVYGANYILPYADHQPTDPPQHVCCYKKDERIGGAHLQPSVSFVHYGNTFIHCIRPLRQSGHGTVSL